jgi:hypothetical protein
MERSKAKPFGPLQGSGGRRAEFGLALMLKKIRESRKSWIHGLFRIRLLPLTCAVPAAGNRFSSAAKFAIYRL